jgi:hypothetical protein
MSCNRTAEAPLYLKSNDNDNGNGNGNGESNDNRESWRGRDLHSHLRRDEAAPKMGHPIVCGGIGRTGNDNGNGNGKSKGNRRSLWDDKQEGQNNGNGDCSG